MYIEFVIIFILIGILAVVEIVNLVISIITLNKINSNNYTNMQMITRNASNYVNQERAYDSVVVCYKCGTEFNSVLRCCPRCGTKRK